MTDRPYWCEICARKKECYGITLKPKCFVPTADRKTEPITHDDYIETENDHLEAKCLNCNNAKACKEKHWEGCVYEPQTDMAEDIVRSYGFKTESYRQAKAKTEPQTDCGDFADRLAYERGVKHAWEVAQKVFDSTVTFYEAEDVAKQIAKDEPQKEGE